MPLPTELFTSIFTYTYTSKTPLNPHLYQPNPTPIPRTTPLLTHTCPRSDAIKKVCEFLGMQACERSDKVADGKSSHALLLSGLYRGGHDVLARAAMILGLQTI